MNHILKEQGYLEGEPGNYNPTSKGMPYVQETDFHRGTGGYANYNRYWTTRKWEDSILDELDLSEEVISEARTAVSERKRQQREERKAASEAYWAEHSPLGSENGDQYDFSEDDTSEADKVYAALGLVLLIGAGVKWVARRVANLWREKIAPKIEDKKNKKVCPKCAKTMRYNQKKTCWICKNCGFNEIVNVE